MRINTVGCGHTAPPLYPAAKFSPFNVPSVQYTKVINALAVLQTLKTRASCNAAFQSLPLGRTFAAVLNDNRVWVSWYRDRMTEAFGWGSALTHPYRRDITLSSGLLNMSFIKVAAVLVHEMAHVNGATGSGTAAEDTLLQCGFDAYHNPNIEG